MLKQFQEIDPVKMLNEIESLQRQFWSTAIDPIPVCMPADKGSLKKETKTASAKQPNRKRQRSSGEKRLAVWHGQKPGRKTNIDEVWDEVCQELSTSPELSALQIMGLIQQRYPGKYRDGQLNTVRDRLERWRLMNYPDRLFHKHKPGKKSIINDLWPEICLELERDPNITLRGLMKMLCDRYPASVRMTQRSTLCNKLKAWRKQHIESITIFEEDATLQETKANSKRKNDTKPI